MRVRGLGAAVGLLGLLATPASAQRPGQPIPAALQWTLRGVEFSACVDFLMAPEAASKQLGEGYRAVPASAFTPINPALQREAGSNPAYQQWIPARVCTIESKFMAVGERLAEPDEKLQREVVGYWGIAATRTDSAPQFDRWFAVQLWANDWHVEKYTESSYIPVDLFKRALDSVPESNRHHYELRIGKTILSWDGQLVGRDSTGAPELPPATLIFGGLRGTRWVAQVTAQAHWQRYLPGVFRVQGKDDLAKALQGSPIRMFGPMAWGGDVLVSFHR